MNTDKKFNILIDAIYIWKRILHFVPRNKVIFTLIMIIYASCGTLQSLGTGLLLKYLSIGAIENSTNTILAGVIYYVLILVSVSAVSWLFCHVYLCSTKMLAEYNIGSELFFHLLNRPLSKEADDHSGDSMSRLVNDGQQVANALTWDFFSIIYPVVNVLLCGVITLFISWQIGIITLLLGLFFLYVTNKFSLPLRKNTDKIKDLESRTVQLMMDGITNVQTVRMMGLEIPLTSRFEETIDKVKNLTLKNMVLSAWHSSFGSAIGILSSMIVIILGIYLVSINQINLPNVLLVFQFSTSAVSSIIQLGNFFTQFQNVSSSSQRVFELFDSKAEDKRVDKPNIDSNDYNEGVILQLDNLFFSYREDLKPALKQVSLTIKKGEHIALVGESGSGKSTLFKILLGLYEAQTGEIRLYGKSYREWNVQSIRRQFAYVAQESPLFDCSIRENISMGKRGATNDQIIEAAKLANANEFISSLPNAYNEQVGELGTKISGGQRQRIALARAFIRNAPILLLDEATASLDGQNEQEIQKMLDDFSVGRTIIVSAHRLSTIKNFDRIVVFNQGEILEIGNHDELLAHNGIYAKLYEDQKVLQAANY
ncbi:ABC transporter ATP-binding protein [Paenibacillus lautus]|uniref:ABC transporter ATP-binding protein n=1 Tax=Paenibacillus lautus TaxID=1401 RepID=UPI003D295491